MNIKETLYNILLVGVSGTALFQLVSAPIGKKENIFDLLTSNAYAGEATKEENLEKKTGAVPFSELLNKIEPEAYKHFIVASRAYWGWVENKPEDKTLEQWLEMNNEKIDERAINECKEAIRIDPKSPMLYYQIAQIYEANKEIDLSIENTQKAIKLENGFADAHHILGRLYKTKEEYNKAIKEFEKSLELNSGLDIDSQYKEFILKEIKECEQKLRKHL